MSTANGVPRTQPPAYRKGLDHPLSQALELRGISRVELARFIGRSHTLVSRVINGHVRPSAQFRDAAARLTGIREEYLFPANDDTTADAPSTPPQRTRKAAR